MYEVYKDLTFEAAHYLPPPGRAPENMRVHGHSFRARLFLRGEPGPLGWVADLGEVEKHIAVVRAELDHQILNEVNELLRHPTLERIAYYIWGRLKLSMPALYKVGVYRDSLGEGCEFRPPLSCDEARSADSLPSIPGGRP